MRTLLAAAAACLLAGCLLPKAPAEAAPDGPTLLFETGKTIGGWGGIDADGSKLLWHEIDWSSDAPGTIQSYDLDTHRMEAIAERAEMFYASPLADRGPLTVNGADVNPWPGPQWPWRAYEWHPGQNRLGELPSGRDGPSFAWDREGDWVLYGENQSFAGTHLWLHNVRDGRHQEIPPEDPAPGPGGEALALHSHHFGAGGDLYLSYGTPFGSDGEPTHRIYRLTPGDGGRERILETTDLVGDFLVLDDWILIQGDSTFLQHRSDGERWSLGSPSSPVGYVVEHGDWISYHQDEEGEWDGEAMRWTNTRLFLANLKTRETTLIAGGDGTRVASHAMDDHALYYVVPPNEEGGMTRVYSRPLPA